jgi:hypothetical protein
MILIPIVGGDYAWAHPDPAGFAAWGARFACRYLSPDPSKNLSLVEAQQLAAYGIACVANFESTATEAENGAAAGAADARMALAQATAAGMPAGRPIYFSVDEGTTVGPHITAYFQGVASVLPHSQIGVYGGFAVVKGCLDEQLVTWAWQTFAWSGTPTQWDPRAQLRQVQNSVTVAGASVDIDHAMTADYGQWTPGGNDDMSQADVDAINAHNNDLALMIVAAIVGAKQNPDGSWPHTLTQIAQGVVSGYNNTKAALDGLPTAVSTAVAKQLPNVTIDQAALEAAVTAAIDQQLSGATITLTPKALA